MNWPWQDRAGNFAPIRAATLLIVCLPASWIAFQTLMGWLGPRPVTVVIHQSGDWAMRLLIATLFISPLRRILDWPALIAARQILGLAAAAYASAHLAMYVADQKFDLFKVASEITHRLYLAIGTMALIGLLILTATSGRRAVARLGGERWTNVHRLIHPITALSLLHFFIQSKLDVSEPLLLSGLTFWLWGYRWLQSRRWAGTTGMLLVLAGAATTGTMVLEVLWYGLATRVGASAALADIFDFSYNINVVWYVLGVGLSLAFIRFARHFRRAGNGARMQS